MQLLAPYAGDDNQAYLYAWREKDAARVAKGKAAKDAEKKELAKLAAAKARRDAAAKLPATVSKGPIG